MAFNGSITGMLSKYHPKPENESMVDPAVDDKSKIKEPKKEEQPIEGTSQPVINKPPSMMDSGIKPIEQ